MNSISVINDRVKKAIAVIAEKEGFHDYSIEISDGSLPGDGYVGIINRVALTGKKNEREEKLLLIVKSANSDPGFRKKLPIGEMFRLETHMYRNVFPSFSWLETEKGLTPTSLAPSFYDAVTDLNSEALILEDLKEKGFEMYSDGYSEVDLDHLNLVMSQYAKLHALSLALKDQQPEKFEELIPARMSFMVDIMRTTLREVIERTLYKSLAVFDPTTEAKPYELLKNFIENLDSKFKEMETPCDKYDSILHGDSWKNNMMFKYEESDGIYRKPVEVRLYDYQVARVGPPVIDFQFYFYGAATEEMLSSLDVHQDLYYEFFADHLTKLGGNPSALYPKEVLKLQWKQCAAFVLSLLPIAIHTAATDKDKALHLSNLTKPDQDFSAGIINECVDVDVFNKRMKILILHFVENSFL